MLRLCAASCCPCSKRGVLLDITSLPDAEPLNQQVLHQALRSAAPRAAATHQFACGLPAARQATTCLCSSHACCHCCLRKSCLLKLPGAPAGAHAVCHRAVPPCSIPRNQGSGAEAAGAAGAGASGGNPAAALPSRCATHAAVRGRVFLCVFALVVDGAGGSRTWSVNCALCCVSQVLQKVSLPGPVWARWSASGSVVHMCRVVCGVTDLHVGPVPLCCKTCRLHDFFVNQGWISQGVSSAGKDPRQQQQQQWQPT
jgi:hypothetical protein